MTGLDAGAAPAAADDTRATESKRAVSDKNYNGQVDPFSAAFNEAKNEIDAKAEKSKPGPKAGAKKADDEDEAPAKKPAPKLAKEEAKEEANKPQDRTYAKADDDEEDGEADAEKKPAKAKTETREPPKYWSEKRKEAFRFQPREVQDEWMEAEPEANERWPTDTKEAFAKLPRDAKEVVLTQLNEADKGLNQKFQALAVERKLAEDIRAAVPPQMRAYFERQGLDEPKAFAKLLQLQHHAFTDPVGYVRQFIAQAKINPLDIIPADADLTGHTPTQQADITSHPAHQAVVAELNTLKRTIAMDRAEREKEEHRRFEADFNGITSETDGEGNSLYPYIRLLADPMARIIEADPEQFGSMGVKERFSAAYRLALQEYPELATPRRTAKPSPADEQDDDDAQAEPEDKRAAKLDRAITPKSRTPAAVPANGGKTGDPLSDAIKSAQKQISTKR